jgi:threonine dehydrogenase-like Zn-dependent dehydrogenase
VEQSAVLACRIGSVALSGTPFYQNVTLGGGPAPVRAYIDELLPDIMEGRIEPGRVFDRTVRLDEVPDGYRAMNDRESLKVLVCP